MTEHDRALHWLASRQKDEELKIGKHLFRVERVRGITVYITKGKGQKLYTLHTTSLEPFTVEVREVWPGSGDLKKDVAAIAAFRP